MADKLVTPERSIEHGILYVGGIVVSYLLSLSTLLVTPLISRQSDRVPWFHFQLELTLIIGYSLRVGLVYAGMFLLAVWVCCGQRSSLIRFFIGVSAATLGSWWLGLFTIWIPRGSVRDMGFFVAVALTAIIAIHFLLVCIVVWGMRRLSGWPAPAGEATASEAPTEQFRLMDIFAVTTTVAIALATLSGFKPDTFLPPVTQILLSVVWMVVMHSIAQAPYLLIASFALYAAADPDRSLNRTMWVSLGLLAVGLVWVMVESMLLSRYPSLFPAWLFVLPGSFSYYFAICGGLLAAREFGWLEVTAGVEREKPSIYRGVAFGDQDEARE